MKKKSPLTEKFWKNRIVPDCPIYDMHGHMGSHYAIHFPQPDAASMVADCKRAGVKKLVFSHHAALFSPDFGNQPTIDAVRAYPETLKGYCAINPNYPEMTKRDVETFGEYKDVYVGFKFLADYHAVAITDAAYEPALKYADEHKLLVLLHTWGDSAFDGQDVVREVAEKYGNAKILLGHSCHGRWDEAIRLAKDFPNVYLELTAVVDEQGILEQFVEALGSEQIIYGTDFPWFSQFYYIGAVLGADITDEDRHNIFHRNAEKLLEPFGG